MSELVHGRYRILAALGQGASGQTYRVRDEETGAERVLKELFAQVPAGETSAWVREAEMLRSLDHPRIPRLHDAFVEPVRGVRRMHLVMDFVEGRDLAAVAADRRLSLDEVLDRAEELLEVLVWLQDRSPPVLHRDLKPHNLIVRERDGALMLIDFGLAVDARARTFGHTMAAGTLGYQAPEQIAGEPVPASDVYGAAVVIWHLLARREPGERLVGQELDWRRDVTHAPSWLGAWLERALAPVQTRFATAREALDALRAGRAGRAVPKRQPQPAVRRPVESEPTSPPREGGGVPLALGVLGAGLVFGLIAAIFAIGAGEEPPRPKPVAEPWVACQAGDADACWRDAQRLLEQSPPDVELAFQRLRRACLGGNGDACWTLGDSYRRGTWQERDVEEALHFMTEACVHNVTNSCDTVSLLVAELPEEAARVAVDRVTARFEAACTEVPAPGEDAWSCAVMTWWAQRELAWVGKRPELGIPTAERMCERGHTDMCVHLAWLLEQGAPGHLEPERAGALYGDVCLQLGRRIEAGDDAWEVGRQRDTACQGWHRLLGSGLSSK